jgi:hypothetical protein
MASHHRAHGARSLGAVPLTYWQQIIYHRSKWHRS